MTEAEWLACRNLKKMMRFLEPHRFDRKLRLFAVACCRRIEELLRDADAKRLLELTEQAADGVSDLALLQALEANVPVYPHAEGAVKQAAVFGGADWQTVTDRYRRAVQDAEAATADAIAGDGSDVAHQKYEQRGRERLAQFAILHDILGNPFRPVNFAPAWRTDTVTALAAQMYDSRDFSAMPILADALQDAGCDSADILDHCRGPGPHVRGCWVVDLALGKS